MRLKYVLFIFLFLNLLNADFRELETPENIDISVASDSIIISWDKVVGEYFYKVYSSSNPYSGFSEISEQGELTDSLDRIYWIAQSLLAKEFFNVTTSDAYWTRTDTIATNIEHKFFLYEHHFMTIIDCNGTLNFRPHPGTDENGWGSSWYAQPFLSGAALEHTNIESVSADSTGINVLATGLVSASFGTFGEWNCDYSFNYNSDEKEITGSGEYSITLDDSLTADSGDLSLYKIASNYMIDVPLLDPPYSGNTGDMDSIFVEVDNHNFPIIWRATDGNHFPNDFCDSLSMDVSGNYNNVDTEAQGYEPIEAAYKPSLKVVLVSQQTDIEMIFGAVYANEDSTCFECDNV